VESSESTLRGNYNNDRLIKLDTNIAIGRGANMSEQTPSPDSISDELRKLGENLKKTLGAMWESEERKSATQNLEKGAAEVGKALENLAAELTQGDTAQQIRQDVDDLQDRFKSGELGEKVRTEMTDSLKRVNEELEKLMGRWNKGGGSESDSE
jgi:hypothetical protein